MGRGLYSLFKPALVRIPACAGMTRRLCAKRLRKILSILNPQIRTAGAKQTFRKSCTVSFLNPRFDKSIIAEKTTDVNQNIEKILNHGLARIFTDYKIFIYKMLKIIC